MEIYSLGIDPGWKNLGIALLCKDDESKVSVCRSGVLNPSDCQRQYGSRWDLLSMIDFWLYEGDIDYRHTDILMCGLERYVPYAGIDTSEAENIQLVIGALAQIFYERDSKIFLYRAFDWKRELCQYLVKEKGFSNPSTSFDKKYSIAAAKACLDFPHDFKTDHQGDAISLAFTNFIHKEK